VGGSDGVTGTRPALVMSEDHDIVPKPGTVRRERDGKPGSLLRPLDYPLIAECISCGKWVRIQRWFQAEWTHVIPQQTAPAEP
jgi:hypothetical protein